MPIILFYFRSCVPLEEKESAAHTQTTSKCVYVHVHFTRDELSSLHKICSRDKLSCRPIHSVWFLLCNQEYPTAAKIFVEFKFYANFAHCNNTMEKNFYYEERYLK